VDAGDFSATRSRASSTVSAPSSENPAVTSAATFQPDSRPTAPGAAPARVTITATTVIPIADPR